MKKKTGSLFRISPSISLCWCSIRLPVLHTVVVTPRSLPESISAPDQKEKEEAEGNVNQTRREQRVGGKKTTSPVKCLLNCQNAPPRQKPNQFEPARTPLQPLFLFKLKRRAKEKKETRTHPKNNLEEHHFELRCTGFFGAGTGNATHAKRREGVRFGG